MPVQVGILGFAHGHVHAYCNQWRQKQEMGVRVVAGWDHDAARAETARSNMGVDVYQKPGELVARPDIDGVVVAAETSMHADLVEIAANAGKTIVLQKPMALTMEQADRIVAAVKRNDVPFTMAWQMRVDPQNIQIKKLIEDGVVGKVFMVRRRHGLSTHTWPNFDQMWHVKPELNRDIWADDAAHAIDFIYWLLGEPQTVTAEIDTLCNPRVPMDNGIAIYRYSGGPIAEVVCSFVCVAGENTTEVIGEKGTIIQNYGDVPSCNVPRPENAPGLKWFLKETGEWTYSDIPSPSNHGERIAALAGPLADFMNGKRGPIATAEEGRDVLRMTLACYESTEKGRRVTLREAQIP